MGIGEELRLRHFQVTQWVMIAALVFLLWRNRKIERLLMISGGYNCQQKFRQVIPYQWSDDFGDGFFMDRWSQRMRQHMQRMTDNLASDFWFDYPSEVRMEEHDDEKELQKDVGIERKTFAVKGNYSSDQKEYKVTITLPEGLSVKDVQLKLENSLLTIGSSWQKRINWPNHKGYRRQSFLQSILLPPTKAQLKDLKKEYNNGQLVVYVPLGK
jgi:HSP20 family molecular chaperone IbpA